jgi:hypothetical protein
MEVPLIDEYIPDGVDERMPTPGAEMFGFKRLLPSTVTGPRLLKDAILSLESVAPTENDAS